MGNIQLEQEILEDQVEVLVIKQYHQRQVLQEILHQLHHLKEIQEVLESLMLLLSLVEVAVVVPVVLVEMHHRPPVVLVVPDQHLLFLEHL